MADVRTITETVAAFVREGFASELGRPEVGMKEVPVWMGVREAGSRLWLDTGDIEEALSLWNSNFEGLTINKTLLNREVQKGIYDGFIPKAASTIREASPDIDERRLLLEIAFALNAYHWLTLVEKFDAYVSVELHTDLANDVEGTANYDRRFYEICLERFYVKVPLTPAGFLAARKLGEWGVPVNFTLGFSARHNYLAALRSRPIYVLCGKMKLDNGKRFLLVDPPHKIWELWGTWVLSPDSWNVRSIWGRTSILNGRPSNMRFWAQPWGVGDTC